MASAVVTASSSVSEEGLHAVGPAANREVPEFGAEAPVGLVRPLAVERSEQPAARRAAPAGDRRPSGRERHEEKITVYISPEELMDLERARLFLRGEHSIAVDRGRIVREALAIVLGDLESRGAASILVRRLQQD
jgi:hypothetical protein